MFKPDFRGDCEHDFTLDNESQATIYLADEFCKALPQLFRIPPESLRNAAMDDRR
jgi:hypothetical protein